MAGGSKRKDFDGAMDALAARLQNLQTNAQDVKDGRDLEPQWVLEASVGLSSALEELRAAEEQLLEARTEAETERYRYQDLFELAPDGYLVTDGRGTITEANRAAVAMLNIPVQYVVGKPLLVCVQKEDRLLYWQIISAMRHAERGMWTMRLTPRHLPPVVAHVTVGSVRSWEGALEGLRWIIRNVTEQQRIETEMRKNRQQLRRLASELSLAEERERRRLANDIHDHIGQTLAMIKLKLAAMRHKPENKPCVPALEEVIGLVTQTIAQTRSLSFELSPPLLYDLGLESALQWLTEQKAEEGITFDFKDDGNVKTASNEIRVLLFQAVRELLVNVIKHARASRGTVSVSAHLDNIVIVVEDNGVGMKKLKRPPKMGGYGLFSVRERLSHLGGEVEISNRPGGGTRVKLVAPWAVPSNQPTETIMSKLNVLMVDDHRMLRQGLRALLEGEGDLQVVAEADNGRSAVELAEKLALDLVIMDVGMKDLNGIEATRRILDRKPGLKVIGLSMHSDRRFVAEMLKAGAVGYVLKDAAVEELVAAIRTVLAGKVYLSPGAADVVVDDYVRRVPASGTSVFSALTPRSAKCCN